MIEFVKYCVGFIINVCIKFLILKYSNYGNDVNKYDEYRLLYIKVKMYLYLKCK